MYEHILLPSDGSKLSNKAVKQGIQLAKLLGSRVTAIHVIAHPAATVLAQIFRRIHRHHPILRSVVQIFEPASERGYAGLTELQKQTASLLAFKQSPSSTGLHQISPNQPL